MCHHQAEHIGHWKGNMAKLEDVFEKKLQHYHQFMVNVLVQAK
jgi:hypothetical protein